MDSNDIMKTELLELSNELDNKGKGIKGNCGKNVYPAAVIIPNV